MTAYHHTPIGWLAIDTDGANITAIRCVPSDAPADDVPILRSAKAWLDRYFAGEQPDPDLLPLAPKGTPFQQLIWSLLVHIPYGQSVTYGALARQAALILGKSAMSAQAIGGAVGRNPILIAIPCHRVLGIDWKLTGFSAGIEKKIALLQIEGISFHERKEGPPH